jgi:hypothetical protein
MPQHFFFGASAVRYETAFRANPDNQDYSVCPRHWYVDAEFNCERCGQEFTWTAREQKAWFEDYFFWVDSRPRHCRECRGELRRLLDLRKEYDATVAAASDHGTIDQKRRIVEIVSELEQTLERLPERMIETKKLFQRQIENRAEPAAGGNAE